MPSFSELKEQLGKIRERGEKQMDEAERTRLDAARKEGKWKAAEKALQELRMSQWQEIKREVSSFLKELNQEAFDGRGRITEWRLGELKEKKRYYHGCDYSHYVEYIRLSSKTMGESLIIYRPIKNIQTWQDGKPTEIGCSEIKVGVGSFEDNKYLHPASRLISISYGKEECLEYLKKDIINGVIRATRHHYGVYF